MKYQWYMPRHGWTLKTMLNDRSQSPKTMYCIFSLMFHACLHLMTRKGKPIEAESRLGTALGLGEGRLKKSGVSAYGCRIVLYLLQMMKTSEISGDSYPTCDCDKNDWAVQFEWVTHVNYIAIKVLKTMGGLSHNLSILRTVLMIQVWLELSCSP